MQLEELTDNGRLVLTDRLNNKNRVTLAGFEGEILDSAFSSAVPALVTSSSDDTVRIWPILEGANYGRRLWSKTGWNIDWSPDGKHVLYAAFETREKTGVVGRVYDPASGRPLATLRQDDLEDHTYPRPARFSPDGRSIVLGFHTTYKTKPGTHLVCVYDAVTGKKRFGLPGFESEVLHQASFSPDGRFLLTVSTDENDRDPVRLWDALTGRFLRLLAHEGGKRRSHVRTSWTPDSQRIFLFTEANGRFLDVATGEVVGSLPMDLSGQWDPIFSPDGQRLLTHQKGQANLWNARTGLKLAELSGSFDGVGFTPHGQKGIHYIQPHASFSPDGRRIVAPSDRTAILWDGVTGQQLAVLRGHSVEVRGAVFSPDNRWVATWADDGVRLWYSDTGKEFFQLSDQQTYQVRFSPDSRWLLANTGWLWPIDPLATARTRKSRDLTPAEKERFGIGPPTTTSSLIDVVSPTPGWHGNRGLFLAQDGKWQAASAAFQQDLEWDQDDVHGLFGGALVLLLAGDREGYHRLVSAHARRLQPVATQYEWTWIARCCALAPGIPDEILQAAARVAEADRAKVNSVEHSHRQRVLAWGAIFYRLGRYEEALQRLKQVSNDSWSEPQIHLYLAMVEHKRGQLAAAKAALARGVQIMAERPFRQWLERLEAQILRKEAEDLLSR